MKKSVLKRGLACSLVILAIVALISMRKAPESEKQKQELYIKLKKAALTQYTDYKKFEFKHIVPVEQMVNQFPELFTDVPVALHQKIADFAEFLYGQNSFEALAQKNFNPAYFKWTAIGLAYNVMPFMNYVSGFFYFDQNHPNTTILKGERDDFILPSYVKALKEYENKIEENNQLLVSIMQRGKKLYEECNKDATSQGCLAVTNEQVVQEKKYQDNEFQMVDLLFNVRNIGLSLASEYKFHIMPGGDCTPVIIKLLDALAHDAELQQLISAFKVFPKLNYQREHEVVPRNGNLSGIWKSAGAKSPR